MRFEFDPAKAAANLAKHGVSLADAELLKWDWLWCRPDARRDYGELREIGFAPLGDRVFCVVFVQRGDVYRIVSLRKANSREVVDYDQALQEFRVSDPDA
ncbi:BrnT family toxin [Azohydromonas lata]|uniref:BrnT family toxin n=1 Tax=Azohydromonas lata TaxID=45677 RepID=UPI0008308781|nr:BrnT family toxin [Azohydromonas lata]